MIPCEALRLSEHNYNMKSTLVACILEQNQMYWTEHEGLLIILHKFSIHFWMADFDITIR